MNTKTVVSPVVVPAIRTALLSLPALVLLALFTPVPTHAQLERGGGNGGDAGDNGGLAGGGGGKGSTPLGHGSGGNGGKGATAEADAQNGENGQDGDMPGGVGGLAGTSGNLTSGGGGGGGGGATGIAGAGGNGGAGDSYTFSSGNYILIEDILGTDGTAGQAGSPGTPTSTSGGNGGGGGGGGALVISIEEETLVHINGFTVQGGSGGTSASGAGGGGGGAGLALIGQGGVINNGGGSIFGGAGGGASGYTGPTVGGDGGAGVFVVNGGFFDNQEEGNVAGGHGGNGVGFGGAGGAGVLANGGSILNASNLVGGNGGQGTLFGTGGRGGDGVVVYQGEVFNTATGIITGGTGGAAPGSFNTHSGFGGHGVVFIAGGNGGTLTNEGAIYGGEVHPAAFPGLPGVGVFVEGDGVTIINEGTIGSPGGTAIRFTGDGNTLEIRAGSTLDGLVVSSGTDSILRLGGDADATFDLSDIGGQPFQFQGFTLFEKTGESTWTLLGTAHQTTPWTISEGTLQVGNGGVTGSLNGDIANEAALVFNRSNALLYDDVISGSGTLTQKGTGMLTLTEDQTYTGVTTIEHGTLRLGNGGSSGTIAGDIVNHSALVFHRSDTLDYGGTISGAGTLVKEGGGTLTFDGDQTFTGATTVEEGTVEINDGFQSATVEVRALATLRGSGTLSGDVTVQDSATLDPVGNFTLGSLVLAPDARVSLNLGAPDALNDLVTVSGDLALGGLLFLAPNDDFTTGVYRLFDYGGTLSGTAPRFGSAPAGYNLTLDTGTDHQVNLLVDYTGLQFWNGATTTPDGTIHGGSGTWNASSRNWTNESGNTSTAWDGLTAIFSGPAGGEVAVADELEVAGLQFATDGYHLLDAGGALVLNAPATEFRLDPEVTATLSTTMSGEGGLYKTGGGTLVLDGINTFAGDTTLAAGAVEIAGDAALGNTSGALIFESGLLRTTASFETERNVSTNALAIFETAPATTLTATGKLTGAGELLKQGDGTLRWSGDLQHTGDTTVAAGTLVSGDLPHSRLRLQANGTFSPGGETAASLTLAGLELNGGRVLFDLGDGGSDHLTITDGLGQLNGPTEFVFTDRGLSNSTYELLDGLAGGWDLSLLSYSGISPVSATFLLSEDESTLFLSLYNGGVISGPILQNRAPVGTPRQADFLVVNSVVTGTPNDNNTINSLIFEPGTSLQIYNTLVVSSGGLNVAFGTATITGGLLATPDLLTKGGGGSLVVNSNIDSDGGVFIQEGSLLLDNSTLTSNGTLTVGSNGTLGGNGLVLTRVTLNHGTVAPGHSPGSLTFNGSYVQSAGGTLEIEVASPTLFDRLLVTGTAQLAGRLEALGFGGYRFAYGDAIAFLQAAEIRGDFSEINVPDPDRFRGRFVKEGGTGSLLIAPRSYTLVAGNAGERSLAGALDGFISARGDDRESVSIALDRLPEEAYSNAFLQISPAFYQTLPKIAIEQTNAHNQLLSQRLGAIRSGARGFQALGLGAPLTLVESTGDAKKLREILVPTPENRWGLWVQGNGSHARVRHAAQVPNHRYRSGGLTTGVDYRWSENFLTGVYGGYQGVRVKYDGGGRGALDSAIGGVYATWQGGGFHSNAILGGAYTAYDARRPIAFGDLDRKAVGKPDGGQFNAYLDLGYTFRAGSFVFEPIVAGQYLYTGLDAFTETGAQSLNLQVERQRAHSLRTQVGGRVAWLWQAAENIVVIPEARAFWQHEYLHGSRDLHASLNGGAGGGFATAPSPGDRDSVFAGAGATAQFGERWSVSCFYNADFARDDFTSQTVSGSIGWQF